MPEAIGRIVFDHAWRVVDASESTRRLLRIPDLVGLDREALRDRLGTGERLAQLPTRLPCSFFRLCRLADRSRRGFFFYLSAAGPRIEGTVEPADWLFGFADDLQVSVAVTDDTGVVAYANRAVQRLMHGLSPEVLIGEEAMRLAERMAADPASVAPVFSAIAAGESLVDSFPLTRLDGTRGRVHVQASPLRYHGLPCGTIWCLTDVSDDAEQHLEETKAIWYRLAATFQHELRNPLQTMQAAVELLRPLQGEEGVRLVAMLEQQVQLVSEYLSEQLQPPNPADLSPGRLSDVVQTEVERSGVRISTRQLSFMHRRPPREPLIRLHRNSLGRVFANVFRNSAQARIDAQITIRYAIGEDSVACIVEDDGPGFPLEMRRRRWLGSAGDPTRHLGLMIASAAVESQGGSVDLANRPEGGARVTIRLPLIREGAVPRQLAADTEIAAAGDGDVASDPPAAPRGMGG